MKFRRLAMLSMVAVLMLLIVLPAIAQDRQRGGRGGGRGREAYAERLVKIMEDAGCPLSEKQVEKIKALEFGQDMQKNLRRILKKDQRAALEKSSHDRRISMMVRSLENSDNPLSEEQVTKLKAVEPGNNSRKAIGKILSEEQAKYLKEAEEKRRGRGRGGERGSMADRLAPMLKTAGHPLTKEQTEKLNALERGPDMRDQMNKILTAEQQKVLQEAFQNRQRQY